MKAIAEPVPQPEGRGTEVGARRQPLTGLLYRILKELSTCRCPNGPLVRFELFYRFASDVGAGSTFKQVTL